MLDIIEHIENDKAFLLEIADKYLEDKGIIGIAAPAF